MDRSDNAKNPTHGHISDLYEQSPDSLQRFVADRLEEAAQRVSEGALLTLRSGPEPPASRIVHQHPVAEFFLQLHGSTTFRIARGDTHLETGAFLIVPPGVDHEEARNADGVNLVGKVTDRHFLYHLSPHGSHARRMGAGVHLGEYESPQHALANACRLLREPEQRQLACAMAASALRLLVLIMRKSSQVDMQTSLLMLCRTIAVESFSDPHFGVAQLAEACGCHPDYLCRLARRHWGTSLHNWLTTMRMQRALALLADPHIAINDVARQCGYASGRYFARVFRRRFGQSPSSFKSRPAAGPAAPFS